MPCHPDSLQQTVPWRMEKGETAAQAPQRHSYESLSLVFPETYRQRPVLQAAELELSNDEDFKEMIVRQLVWLQMMALQ